MRIDRNLRLMTAFTVFSNAMFILGVVVPYYKDVMGLSFQDFLLGEAVFATAVFVLEVPMGWLSDQWQRRRVLALGVFFDLIGFYCLLIGDSLFWALLGQGLIGVGVSLVSGTNSALIYDSLLSAGREGEYRQHEGRRSAVSFYTVAAASLLSGVLYTLDVHLPLLMGMLLLAVSIVLACMMDEPLRHRLRPTRHPLADMAATAHYALRGHAEVGLIILFAAVLFCATKLIMWSQQPYYMAIGLDESLFGVLMAAGFLLAGVSSHWGHLLDGRVGNMRMLGITWVVALAVCVVTGLYQGPLGVVLLMVGGSCLFGLANPRVSAAINARVDSSRRATVLSTQSLVVNVLFVPTSLVVGWVADRHGVGGSQFAIAGWLAAAGLLLSLLLISRDRRQRMLLL